MGAPSEPREVVSTVLFHTKCVSSPGQCFRENTPDALGGKNDQKRAALGASLGRPVAIKYWGVSVFLCFRR